MAMLVLAALAGTVWYWWDIQRWVPEEAIYPDQGVSLSQDNGLVGFATVRALGGKFAYLQASSGADGKDGRFARNLAAARDAGLMVGALHRFDPCVSADRQSANFVTMVPRDKELIPTAIVLDTLTDGCPDKVSDAAMESELLTLINQIEMHVGKPVIIKLSKPFEERFATSTIIERDLWLSRDRFVPRYAGRPWLLWSANRALDSEASNTPIEWVVVQP
ncbi:MAG: glycoside hydrolase family 25 protein [Erythrobacter sp.]